MGKLEQYKNEDLKPYITNYLSGCSWYNPSRRTNNQFYCINPAHNDNAGGKPNMSFNPKKNECHCFNCGIHYDIFDIVALNELIPAEEKESMIMNTEEENKTILRKYFRQAKETIIQKYIDSGIEITPLKEQIGKSEDSIRKQASLYEKAKASNRYAYEYLYSRGINGSIAEIFEIYQESDFLYFKNNIEDESEDWKTIPCEKLLFKYNDNHYSQRILLKDEDLKKYNKKRYYHAGERTIYLEGIVNRVSLDRFPLFICEGEIDTLSFYTIQGDKWEFGACGLGSADCQYLLINEFKKHIENGKKVQDYKIILALDNDSAGKTNQRKLKSQLNELGIKAVEFEIPEGIKDSNEFLMKHPEEFKEQCFYYIKEFETIFENQKSKEVNTMEETIIHEESAPQEQPKQMTPSEYIESASSLGTIEEIEKDFFNAKTEQRKTFKTGFTKLDEALNRGIREGLIVIGARSGTGKTAFVSQVVENLAMKRDYDILFYSLEMSKKELISRSLSRTSAILTADPVNNPNWNDKNYLKLLKDNATTTAEFLEIDYLQAPAGTKKRDIQAESLSFFKSYANHLFIIEGTGTINANDIEIGIQRHKQMTGRIPLVVIDYLQILSKISERDSDIDKLDKNIMRLKQISRTYRIPIVLISAFNRNSYDEESKEESFKGSGGIEYSSDILMTIDFDFSSLAENTPAKRREFVKDQKAQSERSLVIDILKNRQNKLPKEKIRLQFNSEFMIFYAERKELTTFHTFLEESAIQHAKENKTNH